MKLDQVIREQNKLKSEVYSIYRHVKKYRLSFEKYLKMKNGMVYHKSLPRHVIEFIRGYGQALFEIMQMDLVTWGWIYEGVVYTNWTSLPDTAQKRVMDSSDQMEGHHFWKDSNGLVTKDIFS